MVKAAVNNKKRLAARDFLVQHTADVNAGFARKVTAEFDNHLDIAKAGPCLWQKLLEIFADRCQVEIPVGRKIRNTKTAANIDPLNG